MLDVASLWPLKELPSRLPLSTRGKRVHRATAFRWVSRGCRGRKLKAVLLGGCLYTCDEWLRSFIEGTPEPATSDSRPEGAARLDQIRAAEAELRALGL